MKKLILLFLILSVFPLVNANEINLEYRILAGKVVVSEEYNLDNAFEIELPEDASGVSVYRNGNLAEVSDKISVNKGEELKVSYVTKEYLENGKYFLIELRYNFEHNVNVKLVLPEGASLAKSVDEGVSAYPLPDNIGSDGKSIVLEWKRNIKSNEGFPIFVNYKMPANKLYFIIPIVVLVFIVAGLFILLRRKKIKIIEKIVKKTITRKKSDVEKHLKEDEKILVNILKQKGGSCEQGTLVVVSDFSKAKVSALLAELESRRMIKKIVKGKKNIIMLRE